MNGRAARSVHKHEKECEVRVKMRECVEYMYACNAGVNTPIKVEAH